MPVLSLLFIWPVSSLLAFDMVLYHIPFLTASLSLFQKVVKMHPTVKHYRPIALASTLSKVIEHIILFSLNWLIYHNLYSYDQDSCVALYP